MTLAETSWIYQSPQDRKTYEINDIVKVTVSVKSQMSSLGQIDRKKTGYSDWKLTDWIKIYPGLRLGENGGSTGQPPNGTPEIRGDIDSKLQAQGNLQTKDMMSFVISCQHRRQAAQRQPRAGRHLERQRQRGKVGILARRRVPSGGHQVGQLDHQRHDCRTWQSSAEAGHVRDSYRRGWALQWLDKWQPF